MLCGLGQDAAVNAFFSDQFRSVGLDAMLYPERVELTDGELLFLFSGTLMQYGVISRSEVGRTQSNGYAATWFEFCVDEDPEVENGKWDIRDLPFHWIISNYLTPTLDPEDFNPGYDRGDETVKSSDVSHLLDIGASAGMEQDG